MCCQPIYTNTIYLQDQWVIFWIRLWGNDVWKKVELSSLKPYKVGFYPIRFLIFEVADRPLPEPIWKICSLSSGWRSKCMLDLEIQIYVFSCPEQLNRWPCHSVTHSNFTSDKQRAILKSCDLWDIWSECNLWQCHKFWQFRFFYHFRVLTILTTFDNWTILEKFEKSYNIGIFYISVSFAISFGQFLTISIVFPMYTILTISTV